MLATLCGVLGERGDYVNQRGVSMYLLVATQSIKDPLYGGLIIAYIVGDMCEVVAIPTHTEKGNEWYRVVYLTCDRGR